MAASIVRVVPFSQVAVNPRVTLNGVTAGNTLFVLACQLSATDPGWPTDNRADAYTPIAENTLNQAGSPNPASVIMAYCLRAAGGNTSITIPTVAASSGVVIELAGILTPVAHIGKGGLTYYSPAVPDDICSQNCGAATPLSCDITPTTPSGICLAIAVVGGTNALSFDQTGWSSLGSGQTNGLSFNAQYRITSAAGRLPLSWTRATPADGLVLAVSLPVA
jgi:hypothetical protein